jgi:SAM-dependent methyltransferase
MEKVDYGVDAPQVIRNLIVIGLAALFIGIKLCFINPFEYGQLIGSTFLFGSISPLCMALLMFWYGKVGKFKHRERMLALHQWKGDEQVLDVGTGLGLLLIGAAKKLTTGKAVGLDIWNARDLSNNRAEHAKYNIDKEEVHGKATLVNESIVSTTLKDNSFDVVLSNLCIHNIENKAERAKACKEIYRVLKSGGEAIISDFKHTSEYRQEFDLLGMTTEKVGTYYLSTFPPLTIIKARKN